MPHSLKEVDHIFPLLKSVGCIQQILSKEYSIEKEGDNSIVEKASKCYFCQVIKVAGIHIDTMYPLIKVMIMTLHFCGLSPK